MVDGQRSRYQPAAFWLVVAALACGSPDQPGTSPDPVWQDLAVQIEEFAAGRPGPSGEVATAMLAVDSLSEHFSSLHPTLSLSWEPVQRLGDSGLAFVAVVADHEDSVVANVELYFRPTAAGVPVERRSLLAGVQAWRKSGLFEVRVSQVGDPSSDSLDLMTLADGFPLGELAGL